MRLRQISEALTRRRFLQNTSAVLGGWKQAFKMLTSNPINAISNLAKLYGDMDGYSKEILNSFMMGFGNTGAAYRAEWEHVRQMAIDRGHSSPPILDPQEYLEKYTTKGMIDGNKVEGPYSSAHGYQARYRRANNIPVPSIPVEAIMGKLAWLVDQDSDSAVQILSGAAPENFELISPGVISKALDYSIKKYGVKQFADSLYDMNYGPGRKINDKVFNSWELALSNSELSKFMNMTPDMVRTAAKTGRGLAKMVDKGLLGPDDVVGWRDFLRGGGHKGAAKRYVHQHLLDRKEIEQLKAQRKKEDSDRHEREQKEREREEQAKEPEVYKPRPDDYIYGSPMHQPFESRLRAVLARI